MDVSDVKQSLSQSPVVLLDNLRDQFNESIQVPLSKLDGDVVQEITGIYQQTLKENGLEGGIEAEGTVNLLGFETDVSFSWDPGILLSPDLFQWVQGQSEELREQLNYAISLAIVFYREVLRRLDRALKTGLNNLRNEYVDAPINRVTDRLNDLRETVERFRNDPIDEVTAVLFG